MRWLLQKENVPSIAFGVNSVEQLTELLGSTTFELDGDDIAKLDAVSEIPLPHPYDMIHDLNKNRRQLTLGQ